MHLSFLMLLLLLYQLPSYITPFIHSLIFVLFLVPGVIARLPSALYFFVFFNFNFNNNNNYYYSKKNFNYACAVVLVSCTCIPRTPICSSTCTNYKKHSIPTCSHNPPNSSVMNRSRYNHNIIH